MDNQHRAIVGYRELNAEEIAAINSVKETGETLGKLVTLVRNIPGVDKRWASIVATDLQTGIMALVRAIARPTSFVFALIFLAGCSKGLQEKAFKNEHGVYIVSQSLVNDRMTVSQPHVVGEQACMKKHTSEEMAELLKDGDEMSWYYQCQDLKLYRPEYHVALDPPIVSYLKGALEAAIIGGSIGAGLAASGDTITQRGSSTAVAGASAQGGSAINKGHRRR